jgi:NADPH:quinone reductase-like Zn-dependent oxidoreductase
MYEAIINAGPKVELIQSPIPSPNADQVVIKVGCLEATRRTGNSDLLEMEGINQGDDIAGIVHEVGANVAEFKVYLFIL